MPKRESGDLENDWRDWIISHALMTEAQISSAHVLPNPIRSSL